MVFSYLINSSNKTGIDPAEPQASDLLSGIQGNILKHHGRGYALHVLIRLKPDQESIKGALAWLAEGFSPVSAREQAGFGTGDAPAFRMIALSK